MSYYIIKRGVYIQGIYGEFSNVNEAVDFLDSEYKKTKSKEHHNEFDGYHEYIIVDKLMSDISDNELCLEPLCVYDYEPLETVF